RAQIEPRLRIGDCVAEGFNRKCRGIHDLCAHDGQIGDIAALNVEEKRSFLAQRSAHVYAELSRIVPRRFCSLRQIFKGVPRVKSRRISRKKKLSVELVRAGLSQDFDSPVTQLVIFRRERILIDANLSNRSLRRKLPCRESIDIYLAS